MSYKAMYVFVEGDDDERFFKRIVKPILEKEYDSVKLQKYAQVKPAKVDQYLESVKAMGADHVLVADIDLAPCITAKKQAIKDRFKKIDEDRIVVVIKEIESWYLAGVEDDICSRRFGLRHFATTDDLTKEQFCGLIKRKFDSKIDFMIELLKHFSTGTAKRKNKSFCYFLDKYGCQL